MLDLLKQGAEISSKDNDGVSMTILLTVDLISRKVLYLSLILFNIPFENSRNIRNLYTYTIFTSLIT